MHPTIHDETSAEAAANPAEPQSPAGERRPPHAPRAAIAQRVRHGVVEAVAVLFGVLAAFVVDASWERRGEREREAAYLSAIAVELRGVREALTQHEEYLTRDISRNARYLRTLVARDPGEVPPDSIRRMVAMTGPYRYFVPGRAALDDLIHSGGLHLIRSGELRRAIVAYDEALREVAARQELAAAFWRHELSPYFTAHADLHGMLGGAPIRGETVAVAGLRFPVDPAAFVGSRTFANLLVARSLNHSTIITAHDQLRARIDSVLTRIESAGVDPGGAGGP